MSVYRTKEGEVLDQIAFRYYGTHEGTVEAVLEANPNLADEGVTLPAGLLVTLPAMNAPAKNKPIRLWD